MCNENKMFPKYEEVSVASHDFVVSSSDSTTQQDAVNDSYVSLIVVCTMYYAEEGGINDFRTVLGHITG
jgi:alanyl-tRNA synthetase